MFEDGIIITVMGMGTVFSFLVILIFAMVITHKILISINKIFPEAVPETVSAKKNPVKDDVEIAIAIAAKNVL